MRVYQVMFALGLGFLFGAFALAIHPDPQTWEECAPPIMAFAGGVMAGLSVPLLIEAIKQEK
jgi:hypothetical protein